MTRSFRSTTIGVDCTSFVPEGLTSQGLGGSPETGRRLPSSRSSDYLDRLHQFSGDFGER